MRNLSIVLLVTGLTACGGGGSGGSGSDGGSPEPEKQPFQPTAADQIVELTRKNSSPYAGAVYDLVAFGSTGASHWRQLLSEPLSDGNFSEACDSGGEVKLEVSSQGQKIREKYYKCTEYDYSTGSEYTLNGTVTTEVGKPSPEETSVISTYEDYAITRNTGERETVNLTSTIRYTAGEPAYSSPTDVSLSGRIESDSDGLLEIDRFKFTFTANYEFLNWYDSPVLPTGRISYNRNGFAEISTGEDDSVRLSGLGEAFLDIRFSAYYEGMNIHYFQNAHTPSASLHVSRNKLLNNEADFYGTGQSIPYRTTTYTTANDSWQDDGILRGPMQHIPIEFSVLQNFFDPGAQLLDFEVAVDSIVEDLDRADLENIALDLSQLNEGDYSLHYDQRGTVTLQHNFSGERYIYTLRIRAKNSDGAYSPQDLLVEIHIKGDNDGDLELDILDPDDDNDGIEDYRDAFPYDPAEHNDNDGDGIGDIADTDDDNDDIVDTEDFYPNNANCHREIDGDGTSCWVEHIGDLNVVSSESLTYFFQDGAHSGYDYYKTIIPYDWESGQFGKPKVPAKLEESETIREVIPDPSRGRLILVSSKSRLYELSDNVDLEEAGLLYEIPYEFKTSAAYRPTFAKVGDYWVASYATDETNSSGIERSVRNHILLDSDFRQVDWFQGDPDYTWAYNLLFVEPHQERLAERGVRLDLTNLQLAFFEQAPILQCSELMECPLEPDPHNGDFAVSARGKIYNQNNGILAGFLEGFDESSSDHLQFYWKDNHIYQSSGNALNVYDGPGFSRVAVLDLGDPYLYGYWHKTVHIVDGKVRLFDRVTDPNDPEGWDMVLLPREFELPQ